MAETYNIPTIIKGDTFRDLQFTVTINSVALNLTGYAIACKFRKGGKTGTEVKSVSIGSGINVTDAVNGVFKIEAFDVDWAVATYYYDIEFTDTSGVISTYIKGQVKIEQDVTY